jgi:Tripartite tricarboxylate transporter TctB family
MRLVRNPSDFYAGLLFMAFGVAALVIAQSYAPGTAARMGPGYFPRLLGSLLVGLGALQSLIALRANAPASTEWRFRPLLVVLLSVSVFILLAPWVGLVLATLALVLVSSAASPEFRWREALLSGALQGVAAALVFIYGLKLSLPVWPIFVSGG